MEYTIKNTEKGRVLWICHLDMDVGIALDFGIRVVHLSAAGMENLYYAQPADLSDGFVTPSGWKLYGGHRMWLAPESDDSYMPDNEQVEYTVSENAVTVTQKPDLVVGVQKQLKLVFTPEGIRAEHTFTNITDRVICGASWGVNTLELGGTATIAFDGTPVGDYTPRRIISLWADTNPHDSRLQFTRDVLIAKGIAMDDYCKLGLYCRSGKATLESKLQRFTLTFPVPPMEDLPDNGCNFELYLGKKFMELEVLGTKKAMNPGESVTHWEMWKVDRL